MPDLSELNNFAPDEWKCGSKAQIYVPIGWEQLVLDCHEKLKALNPNYEIHQIKEKFGALRYYIGYNTDDILVHEEMSEVIQEYEHKSNLVCQVCGESGSTRNAGGLYITLCDKHYEESK